MYRSRWWRWSVIQPAGWWTRCRCRSRPASRRGTAAAASTRPVGGASRTDDTRWNATARRRRLPRRLRRPPPSTATTTRWCSATSRWRAPWVRSRLTAYSGTDRLPVTSATDSHRSWTSQVSIVCFCTVVIIWAQWCDESIHSASPSRKLATRLRVECTVYTACITRSSILTGCWSRYAELWWEHVTV